MMPCGRLASLDSRPGTLATLGPNPFSYGPCMAEGFEIISLAHERRESENPMQYLRTGGRIPIELPLEIRWKARDGKLQRAEGKTASISANGVLMTVPVKLPPHTPITIAVNLPVEFTKVPLQILCQGRVVRQSAKVSGLRAVIDNYKLRPVRHAA